MQVLNLTMLDLLILLTGSVGLSVILSGALYYKIYASFRASQIEKISELAEQTRILTSGSIGLGKKMLALETKLANLKNTQEEMKVSDLEFSYTQAQKLVKQGVDTDSIAMNSGLSASEVRLMELLHRQSQGEEERVL